MQDDGYHQHRSNTTPPWNSNSSNDEQIPAYVEMNNNSRNNKTRGGGGGGGGEPFPSSRQQDEKKQEEAQQQQQQRHRDNVFRLTPPDVAASGINRTIGTTTSSPAYPSVAPTSYGVGPYTGALQQTSHYHDYGPPSSFESSGSGSPPGVTYHPYGPPSRHHAPPPGPYHPHHLAQLHPRPHPGIHSYPAPPPGIVGYYHPPLLQSSWGPHPLPGPPMPLVQDVTPNDVLCGRGGATNSHSGNRAFRALVKGHQKRYLQAKKRDKPSVASIVVELIRKKGGRFLRRYDTNQHGQVLWVDIGDDRAREKTCQALRENAPEIRRRQKARTGTLATSTSETPTSSEEEDHHHHVKASSGTSGATSTHYSSPKDTLSTSSSHSFSSPAAGRSTAAILHASPMPPPPNASSPRLHNGAPRILWPKKANHPREGRDDDDDYHYPRHGSLFRRSPSLNRHHYHHRHHTGYSTSDDDHYNLYGTGSSSYGSSNDDGPITIRPMARLLPKRQTVEPIPLDQLSPEDRDLYLRDFLPPCPPIPTKPATTTSATLTKSSSNSSNNTSSSHKKHEDDHLLMDGKEHSSPQPQSGSAHTSTPQQQQHRPWPIVSV